MNIEDDVLQFLQAHPDYLLKHEDLFAKLMLPSQQGEHNTISLVEHQVQILRKKNQKLEQKLEELIYFGEVNDAISDKVHQLSLQLLAANDFEDLHQRLINCLDEVFNLPLSECRVWLTGLVSAIPKDYIPSDKLLDFLQGLEKPFCGSMDNGELLSWLPASNKSQVASVVVIPLHHQQQLCGALMIGSDHADHFYPSMGTLYLERIGQILSASLERLV